MMMAATLLLAMTSPDPACHFGHPIAAVEKDRHADRLLFGSEDASCCRFPSSKTEKSSPFRPLTSRPLRSDTQTPMVTRDIDTERFGRYLPLLTGVPGVSAFG
jgi:hypothetical protein